MTSRDFVIWLKGFTEACNDFTATPKQWDRIKEVLDEVEDYNDNPGIDEEIDDWYLNPNTFREPQKSPYIPPYWTGDPPGWMQYPITTSGTTLVLSGSGSGISFSTSEGNTTTTVWNDSMGNWHYTNNTAEIKKEKEKQQLND